ncbi:ATP-grasp domain-containing protein [Fluviispira multicolorata]|uniref:ATP-grasp domain-containing protein n=1 Tax=Fluviispira multicolorata TaxID=2654512 RepID=A0A833N5N4_9BACT|nr:ATP-grasp domain-containing protein [Fluviispira multicolorata]KAB8028121.1 ATP-grasp domain-containing protein [Fluviispira multicolorata]
MKKDCLILIENNFYYKNQLKKILNRAVEKGYHAISIIPEKLLNDFLEDVSYQVIPVSDFENKTLEKIISLIKAEYNIIGLSTPLGYFKSDSSILLSAQVAKIAQNLNLPHNNSDALYNSHNKFLMREVLKENHIYSVKFALLECEEDIIEKSSQVGFPLIAKPVMGMASGFVSKCNNIYELQEAYRFYKENVRNAFYDICYQYKYNNFNFDNANQLLVEELIAGNEYSVEIFCDENKVLPLLIHEKFNVIERNHCVYENITVTPPFTLTEDEQKKICQYSIDIVKALGLKNCFCHLELRLDKCGQPSVIEVNPRVGGSRVRDNLEIYYNFKFEDIFISQAIGQPIKEFQKKYFNNHFAISVIYPYEKGILKSITGLAEVESYHEVINAKRHYKDGEFINGENEEMFVVDILHKGKSIEEIIENDNKFRNKIRINIKI